MAFPVVSEPLPVFSPPPPPPVSVAPKPPAAVAPAPSPEAATPALPPTPAPVVRTPDPLPITPALVAMLPEAMGDLMREFLRRKDLVSRVQLKFRMKALLDFASADTEYPPNPLISKETAPSPARYAAFQMGSADSSQAQAPGGGIGTADLLT